MFFAKTSINSGRGPLANKKEKLTMARKDGMLGKISIKEFQGPLMDFMCKLQDENGREEWFKPFKRFLRKENPWPAQEKKWREENGVIYFNVGPTDGTTGKDWIYGLEDDSFRVREDAREILRSPDFKSTEGVTYEIAVLKGTLFRHDHNKTTKKIRTYASERGLIIPTPEIACYIREKFTDADIEAMGLFWIVTMHQPIRCSDGVPRLLDVNCGDGGLGAFREGQHDCWPDPNDGFAFVVSQKTVE